jgi:hypothetical protein
MEKVECKTCGEIIFAEYDSFESLNCRKGPEKHFSQLTQKPNEKCNTTIYLTCCNDHLEKYYCEIETEEVNRNFLQRLFKIR